MPTLDALAPLSAIFDARAPDDLPGPRYATAADLDAPAVPPSLTPEQADALGAAAASMRAAALAAIRQGLPVATWRGRPLPPARPAHRIPAASAGSTWESLA